MSEVTYKDLAVRNGHTVAFDLLLLIEKSAGIRDTSGEFDEEARLNRALEKLSPSQRAAW